MSYNDRPEFRRRRDALHRLPARRDRRRCRLSRRDQYPAGLPRRRLRHLQVPSCESGDYDGGDYIEDALTEEEAARRLCPLPARCGRNRTA